MERIGKSLYNVAPLAGAWIEIIGFELHPEHEKVAPLAGAWIEILYPSVMHSKSGSLPSRERGLKCHDQSVQQFAAVSLPSRERGLKYAQSHNPRHRQAVAPLAGAWIEIIWQEKTGMRK